ncbi:MAG: phage portal protein [Alphaproteobacteria bacterium]
MRFSNLLKPFLRAPEQMKTSRAGPMIAWSNVGQPQWTPRRMSNLAEEGFRKNVIAYRCVMQIATAAAAVPWVLYDEAGNPLDQHPLLDLLAHPNPLQDGVTFMESVYANLQIYGNAYIEAIRPHDDETPIELYALRPDRMKVIPGPAGLPQGYQYNVNGQVTNWAADPISGDSPILHLKQFHPLDDWYGLAPMEAALQSIDQHNASGAWNQALLNQGARPSGALVYSPKDGGPATLSDEQLQRLREEMGQLYQGDRNAGRPLILEGGLSWQEMSLTPKDMDWLSGRNNAARDIALAFGVPSQLIGLPDAQTYANVEQARLAFYEETILPQLTRVIAGIDHWLCPMYPDQPELDFDPTGISALTEKQQAQWNKIQNARFLTRNEKRQAAGYGPVPGGDEDDDGGNSDDEDGPAAKFNPNHDELDRFTFGPGGADDNSDSSDSNSPSVSSSGGSGSSGGSSTTSQTGGTSTIDDPPIQPVYPIETALTALLGGEALAAEGAVEEGAGALAEDAGAVTQRLMDLLAPDGQPIGEAGSDPTIRELPGDAEDAQNMFNNLTQGGTLNTPDGYGAPYGGTAYNMPDGGFIGYRPASDSGPPTIDINIPNIVIRKLKFAGGGQ